MARIVTIVNQKGGVGKTTTAVNLAACLGVLEKKVLLVDMDPQGNATSMSSITATDYRTIYDMMGDDTLAAVYDTELPYLKVIPGNPDLTGAEIELLDVEKREFVLRDLLKRVSRHFDLIIIDSPPSLNILTVNNMAAADGLIIPIQCEYFALEGVSRIVATIERIRKINPKLAIDGILLTMYDKRVKLTFDVEQEVRKHFGKTVFQNVIARNVKLSESPSFGKPIILYDISSIGAKQYLALAEEYLERIG
ncbi:MAG TPA: ParA family protein [bacterium]|nr:ParA family protein [bacterium]